MIRVRKEAVGKELVDAWYGQWEALQKVIHTAHDTRDGSAASIMEQGITLFEQFVVGASEASDMLQEDEYELLPINGVERLQFIKTRPGQYACYRQLDELFKETKKRCARLRLK